MDSHGSPSRDILFVTGGYDHLIKFWRPHDGVCHRTVQHPDSVRADLSPLVHTTHARGLLFVVPTGLLSVLSPLVFRACTTTEHLMYNLYMFRATLYRVM